MPVTGRNFFLLIPHPPSTLVNPGHNTQPPLLPQLKSGIHLKLGELVGRLCTKFHLEKFPWASPRIEPRTLRPTVEYLHHSAIYNVAASNFVQQTCKQIMAANTVMKHSQKVCHSDYEVAPNFLVLDHYILILNFS
ncbi:hypothetical protein Btru_077310 [Bulinus truncatus]|nr:hypothetical protein Btru_077310 [Bulinus truncatus]